MHRISRARMAACAVLVLGTATLVGVAANPAQAADAVTGTVTATAQCGSDPNDPDTSSPVTVTLTGTAPHSVTVGDTYPVSVDIALQVDGAEGTVTGITAEPLVADVAVAILDTSGTRVDGGVEEFDGPAPTLSITDGTLSLGASASSPDEGTGPAAGSVVFQLLDFQTTVTLPEQGTHDLFCDFTTGEGDPPTGSTFATVQVRDGGSDGKTTPPPSVHPSAPATSAASTPAPVQPRGLANTGAGNAVPLTLAGIVLVLVGVGMVLFVRRRRPAVGGSRLG